LFCVDGISAGYTSRPNALFVVGKISNLISSSSGSKSYITVKVIQKSLNLSNETCLHLIAILGTSVCRNYNLFFKCPQTKYMTASILTFQNHMCASSKISNTVVSTVMQICYFAQRMEDFSSFTTFPILSIKVFESYSNMLI